MGERGTGKVGGGGDGGLGDGWERDRGGVRMRMGLWVRVRLVELGWCMRDVLAECRIARHVWWDRGE